MAKTFQIDEAYYNIFVAAVANAHGGISFGHISEEIRNALDAHIKKMNKKTKVRNTMVG